LEGIVVVDCGDAEVVVAVAEVETGACCCGVEEAGIGSSSLSSSEAMNSQPSMLTM